MESIELVCQLKTSIDQKGSFQSTTTNSNDDGFSERAKGFFENLLNSSCSKKFKSNCMPTKDKFGPRFHWFGLTFWGMFTKGHCEVYVSF